MEVRPEASGGSVRSARFSVDRLASSEFGVAGADAVDANVLDAHELVVRRSARFGEVACLKLNREGGGYEVLERLVDGGSIARCRSLSVQWPPQPAGWADRRDRMAMKLRGTHRPAWQFPMFWEKWIRSETPEFRPDVS